MRRAVTMIGPEPIALPEWQHFMNEQNQDKFGNYLKMAKPRGVFIDVGCEVGQWTFAALAAGFERVVAVDYDSQALRQFRLTAQKYGQMKNIQIVQCAVIPGWTRKSNDEIGWNYFIDLMVQTYAKIQLMKIDIEGMEYSILTDSLDNDWMNHVRWINLETHGTWPVAPKSGIHTHTAMEQWMADMGWDRRSGGNYRRMKEGANNEA